MIRCRVLLPLLLLLSTGCGSEAPALDSPEPAQPVLSGTAFNPATAGRVTGCITWNGIIPKPAGFVYGAPRADGQGFEFRTAKNPNRLRIDPNTRAVAGAVVFLREVDPAAGRPWDLPDVRVEIGNAQIAVVQGERKGRVGFVRRGAAVAIASTEPAYHVLRGRGAAFFGLTLPDANQPVTRTLATAGRVELSSGTGLYWARADLFVADHPYFTLTDTEGRFVLDRVPRGNAEVVVWLPGWDAARQERDPDSTVVVRQSYTPPIERTAHVLVEPTKPVEVNISVP